MTNVPQVIVERGDNPQVLQLSDRGEDPSGFEQDRFSRRDVQRLLASVQSGVQHAYEQAPESLLQFAPKKVKLYSNLARRANDVRATTLFNLPGTVTADYGTEQTPDGLRLHINKYTLHPIAGLMSSYLPSEVHSMGANIRQSYTHEGVHVLTGDGVRFAMSVSEAVACRIEEIMFGPCKESGNDVWDENAMTATTGLRPKEDFALFRMPQEAKGILYIAGPLALRFLTAEKIWKVCGRAVEIAHERDRVGQFVDFAEAARTSLSEEDAEKLLQSIPVREAEPGLHQCVFPSHKRDRVAFFTFGIRTNPRHNFQTPEGFDNHEAEWLPVDPQHMDLFPFLKGTDDEYVEGIGYTMGVKNALFHRDITLQIERATSGTVGAKDIDTIRCDLGFQVFDLLPPEAQ